jgi:hypothetical protein
VRKGNVRPGKSNVTLRKGNVIPGKCIASMMIPNVKLIIKNVNKRNSNVIMQYDSSLIIKKTRRSK